MSDCRFGVSPVNYPDPDPERKLATREIRVQSPVQASCFFLSFIMFC